jgi:hypothetical protein
MKQKWNRGVSTVYRVRESWHSPAAASEFFSRWQIMDIASFVRARVYGYHVREVGVHFDDRAHKNRQILRGVMAEYQDVRFESFRASWKMFLKERMSGGNMFRQRK